MKKFNLKEQIKMMNMTLEETVIRGQVRFLLTDSDDTVIICTSKSDLTKTVKGLACC